MRRSTTCAGTDVHAGPPAGRRADGRGDARRQAVAPPAAPAPVDDAHHVLGGVEPRRVLRRPHGRGHNLGGPPERVRWIHGIAGEFDGAVRAVTASGVLTGAVTSSSSQPVPMNSSARWRAAVPTSPPRPTSSGSCSHRAPPRMSDSSLRIVELHELFHYAARAGTATDAPRWMTEGVADFVGPALFAATGTAPTAESAATADGRRPGRRGSDPHAAYDRAWWFSRFVADRYGTATLRRLYDGPAGPATPTSKRPSPRRSAPTSARCWPTGGAGSPDA